MKIERNEGEWLRSNSKVFWGEIAPNDHVVQIYEDDEVFLDLLEGFVSGGFKAGDSVVVIATAAHLNALEFRLRALNYDLIYLQTQNLYIPMNANQSLEKFMVDGWPDEKLFNQMVSGILEKARKNNRTVRAFGEMVAILWGQGFQGATVELEHLWNKFCESEAFCLFCAYPKHGFTEDAHSSLMSICCKHSKIVAGWGKPLHEISYQLVEQKKAV